MPHQLFDADINFPQFKNDQKDSEKIKVIQNYLYMLLESLRYAFANIDMSNFNEAGLEELSNVITEPIEIRVSDAEGRIATVEVKADEISLTVEKLDKAVASINEFVDENGATITLLTEYRGTGVNNTAAYMIMNACNNGISSIQFKADIISFGNDMFVDGDGAHVKRLYSTGGSDGSTGSTNYYAKVGSDWGDFGIYGKKASDDANPANEHCVFGVYNWIDNGISLYTYGYRFLGVSAKSNSFTVYPVGTWDFSGVSQQSTRVVVRYFNSLSELRNAYSGDKIDGMIGFVLES